MRVTRATGAKKKTRVFYAEKQVGSWHGMAAAADM